MFECSERNKMHFGEVSISLSYSSKGKYMSDKSSMLHAIIGKTERIRICRRWWWWIWSTLRLQLQLFLKRTLNINSLFPPPLPFLSLVGIHCPHAVLMCCHFLAAAKGVVIVVGMEFPRKSRVAVVSVCILITSMIMPTCPVITEVQKKKKKWKKV